MTTQELDKSKKPKHNLAATKAAIDTAMDLEEVRTNLKCNIDMRPKRDTGFIKTLYSKRTELFCISGRDPDGTAKLIPALFDDPEMYQDYPERKLVFYIPVITTYGQFGYWPLKQPYNGKVMPSHTTGKNAAQIAEERWTTIYWDQSSAAYTLIHPKDERVFDGVKAEWPDKLLMDREEYLIKALDQEDYIITDPEDPRLRRMVGEIY